MDSDIPMNLGFIMLAADSKNVYSNHQARFSISHCHRSQYGLMSRSRFICFSQSASSARDGKAMPRRDRSHLPRLCMFGNNGDNRSNNKGNGRGNHSNNDDDHDEQENIKRNWFGDFVCVSAASTASSQLFTSSLAVPTFEVQGAMRTDYQLQPDGSLATKQSRRDSTEHRIVEELFLFFFPEGYAEGSVGPSYLKYSTWRGLQNIISSMTHVLSTHALLTAVGVNSRSGTGVLAATSWVLKDGAAQLGKIMSSRIGYLMDSDSKYWRLFSDIIYDFGLCLELLTPLVPHAFLLLAPIGNFCKSVSVSIGMSCRNSVLTTFVRRENLGEISAKNDAQNTITNLTGMALGINMVRVLPENPKVRVGVFLLMTAVYSCLNYLAMKSVELRTLNRQRLSFALDSWVRDKTIPTTEQVNKYEVIIPFKTRPLDMPKIRLGASLISVSHSSGAKLALLCKLYKNEKYILSMDPQSCEIRIALHEKVGQPDLMQAMLQAAYIRRQVISRMNPGCDTCEPWANNFGSTCLPSKRKIRQKLTGDEIETIAERGLAYAKQNLKDVQAELAKMQFTTKTLLLAPDRFRASW